MFFFADFLRPAKSYVVTRHTAPRSTEGSSKQVVSAVTPCDFSLQPTRDECSGSGWCTDSRQEKAMGKFQSRKRQRRAATIGAGRAQAFGNRTAPIYWSRKGNSDGPHKKGVVPIRGLTSIVLLTPFLAALCHCIAAYEPVVLAILRHLWGIR
jgi:hypothetical protein